MNNLILTLLYIPKVGRKTVDYFINNMKDIPKTEKDIVDIFINIKSSNKRINIPTIEDVKLAYEKANEIAYLSKIQNIKSIDILNENFPKKLRYIENHPQILFYKGNYDAIINENTLAIIGSRECSSEGQKNSYNTSYLLAKENYSIISGLALGCDTYAHKGALDAKGLTVGVLSCGLDTIYPNSNKNLAENIIENKGCLLSEYPIQTKTFKTNFVERDRIESGLGLGTIVVEADIKSGTMHTANFTLQQNRILACFDIDKSGNKFLLENEKVVPIKNNKDLLNIKSQLERVKYNLYK